MQAGAELVSLTAEGACCRSFYHSGCFGQCLQYFSGQLMVPPRAGPAYERFLMQCMVLVHTVLTCKAYRGVPEAIQIGDTAQVQARRHRSLPRLASALSWIL